LPDGRPRAAIVWRQNGGGACRNASADARPGNGSPEIHHRNVGRAGEYLKTPLTGEGGKQTGWYKAQLGPGGFSIVADFEDESPLGKEIGHELFAWDASSSAYTTATVGNFPGMVTGKAKWEGDNLVTELDFKMGDAVIHNRAVYSHVGEKTFHLEESYRMGDAPYQLMWKADATKK
jgi:hypothetical protein